jgi:2-hydroxychromene-2-carboxylate isomerase
MDEEHAANGPQLEFWFEFGSNYSYLSVMRIEALARSHRVAVAWKPFLLGPIFHDLGWSSSPFVLQPQKGKYMWRDMERQASKFGLPFRKPSEFPRLALLPMRVALLGASAPWIAAFCREVMRQNWVDDLDINDPHNVRLALDGLVPDPEQVLRQAQEADNKLRLREQTEEARRRGIFGAPTFFAGSDMFWGNDRMDDAFVHAAAMHSGANKA